MKDRFKDMYVFKVVGRIIIGLIIAAAAALLFGFIVMLLWNWLMPEIFGLAEISYIQAWGLLLLAHILIKSGYSDFRRQNGIFHRRLKGKENDHFKGQENKEDWKREFFSKMHEHKIDND